MDIVNVFRCSASKVIRGTETALVYQPHKCVHYIAGQLGPGNLPDNGYSLFKVHPVPVGSIGIHGVKAIRDGDDLCDPGNVISLEMTGVTLAVRTFVMRLRPDRQFRHDADFFQCFIALEGMRFNCFEFLILQLSGLVQDLRGYADLPDIVQQCNLIVLFHRIVIIPQLSRQTFAKACVICRMRVIVS